MNQRTHSLAWVLRTALLGVVVLALVLLILTEALPAGVAWQPNRPGAITNAQKAAILGVQHLLQFEQVSQFTYLPILTR